MADSEPLLRSLGITLKSPFRWGEETQANLDPTPTAPETAMSGLDSLIQFVQENEPTTTDGTDNRVKQVISSLLKEANVPLSNPDLARNTNKPHRKRYFELLEGDGELGSRDVSIRGLSDRACAELTVESRSSLFGSILRLFDMDREAEKVGTSDFDTAATPSAPEISVAASSSDANESADTEKNVANKHVHGLVETESNIAANEVSEVEGTGPTTDTLDRVINQLIVDAPILSTAEIVRSCHLTAKPGCIPPGMDSKEYTMAALHFLSSHVPLISENDERDIHQSLEGWQLVRDTFPILPLLMATNPEESLEKRSYGRMRPLIRLGQSERKQYPDSMDSDPDFRRKVLNLERVFCSSLPFSPTSHSRSKSSVMAKRDEYVPFAFQRYVPRRKLCPRIETDGVKEELTLMISGHVQQDHQPQSASAKSK